MSGEVPWPELDGGPAPRRGKGFDPGAASAGTDDVSFLPVVDIESWRRVLGGVAREDEIALARNEGYRAGLEQGRAQGTEETLRKVHAARDLLNRAAEELRSGRASLLRSLEEDLVRLALGVATRVVTDLAERDRELVTGTIREALRRAEGESAIVVRVNPKDLEAAKRDRESLRETLEGLEKIDLIPDRRVGPGGCVIETPASRIDARIDAQVNELVEAILETMGTTHEPELAGLDVTASNGA